MYQNTRKEQVNKEEEKKGKGGRREGRHDGEGGGERKK